MTNSNGTKSNSPKTMTCCFFITCILAVLCSAAQANWKPTKAPLMTRWAKDVRPHKAHPEYPRPQLVRKNWLNLNGLWQYAIRPRDNTKPADFDGQILVPFPIESALSGVMKKVGPQNRLWYRRSFNIPKKWTGKRILLHFGAVDWETTIWLNGKQLGTHRGGYDPFTFDVTDALAKTGPQQILLSVWDPSSAGTQPYGKQVTNPGGIMYTPSTGIWQTTWLEPVNAAHIKSLKITTDIDTGQLSVTANCSPAAAAASLHAEAKDGWFTKASASTRVPEKIVLTLSKPKLWSPDSPFLYDLNLTLKDTNGRKLDTVKSYFGMRKISIAKDQNGINRIILNNKSIFQYGPLDQGYWPDGLHTAPTDNALRYDIEVLKKLGCNMLRKHVKVEPARFYYWADKLGLLIWQDMPSVKKKISHLPEAAQQFEIELSRMIDTHYNHPSIVMWVIFNEGWGQYGVERLTDQVRRRDPTRLVNSASGWRDRGTGDIRDVHKYPGPTAPFNEPGRAAVLGEFGGLGLPIKGHTWQQDKGWGYRNLTTRDELTATYLQLLDALHPYIAQGLCAAVYTQTSDIETELNGLMTYDRRIIKMEPRKITAAARRLYKRHLPMKILLPPPPESLNVWRFSRTQPPAGWHLPSFDDSQWRITPGQIRADSPIERPPVGNPWPVPAKSTVWLRQTFDLPKDKPLNPQIVLYYNRAKVELYLNGCLLQPPYKIDPKILTEKGNCLALKCQPKRSYGYYIDAHLVDAPKQ